jgi:hypothetical protein
MSLCLWKLSEEITKEHVNEISEFVQEVYNGKMEENALKWYVKKTFIKTVLDYSLRSICYVEFFFLRYYLYCLFKNLKSMTSNNTNNSFSTLYVGTSIKKQHF